MAIIIFPSVKKGGGDIAFMVNIANSIFEDNRVHAPIIMVSEFKELILEKYQLNPKITIITPEVFEQQIQKKELIPTLIVEGPTFIFGRGIKPPQSAAILYLTEYSSNEERTGTDTTTLTSLARHRGHHAVSLEAGFRFNNKLSAQVRFIQNKEREFGILLDKHCLELFKESSNNPDEFRKKQWLNMSKEIVALLLGSNNPSNYHAQTQLFFQYCHKTESVNNFLRAMLDVIMSSKDQRNCDYISIGEGDRLKELVHAKDAIISAGFGRVIYVDKTNKEHAIFNDHNKNARTFRLIALPSINHANFLSLLALSEKLAGLTGDQSFSEALALGKLIIYECYGHKEAFFKGYVRLTEILGLNELAVFLNQYAYFIDEINSNLADINKTGGSLDFNKLKQQMHILREHIIKEYDFRKVMVASVVNLLQLPEPNKNCAKTKAITAINKRIGELSPKITPAHDNNFWELTFLVSVRRFLLLGFTLQESVTNGRTELESHADFANRKVWFFQSKTYEIPPFINEAIKQQLDENEQVTINTALSSNFDLLSPLLSPKS